MRELREENTPDGREVRRFLSSIIMDICMTKSKTYDSDTIGAESRDICWRRRCRTGEIRACWNRGLYTRVDNNVVVPGVRTKRYLRLRREENVAGSREVRGLDWMYKRLQKKRVLAAQRDTTRDANNVRSENAPAEMEVMELELNFLVSASTGQHIAG